MFILFSIAYPVSGLAKLSHGNDDSGRKPGVARKCFEGVGKVGKDLMRNGLEPVFQTSLVMIEKLFMQLEWISGIFTIPIQKRRKVECFKATERKWFLR